MTKEVPTERLDLAEEQLEITKRGVERGRVVVRTRAEIRGEIAEIALRQEEATVERVPIGMPVDVAPTVREEDGVLIIPIVEEQLVMTTRLILKEEIRIVRRARTELVREPVSLRSERADIERLEGRPAPTLNTQEGVPSMTDRTLTAMYDTRGAAESTRDQLVGIGVAREAISIRGDNGTATPSTTTSDKGFWASLADFFMPDEDRHTYTEGLKRGGYLLSVRVSNDLEEAAEDILESSDPIDLEQRSESWRQDGWAGYEATASANANAPAVVVYGESAGLDEAMDGTTGIAAAPVQPAARESHSSPLTMAGVGATADPAGDDVVQVAEEELRVGKRDVGRGSVRVRSYVTKRPVEEQVELRQERVTIERRPVNRELAAGDTAFEERTIEAVERGEEAEVSKTARVTEEIGLRKDVERETETIRDTVRKQEVEIEDDRAGDRVPGTAKTSPREPTVR